MPDGEIYTGPVEDSVNGWVKFTYPAIYGGVAVEGAELTFNRGRVEIAQAEKNQAYLLKMLESDEGARHVGEYAIGTNSDIDRFTGNILFDEKIGGTFHMALGAGYPETGSHNKSSIHWDMICDLRTDSEILVDGELFYKNGSLCSRGKFKVERLQVRKLTRQSSKPSKLSYFGLDTPCLKALGLLANAILNKTQSIDRSSAHIHRFPHAH